MRKLISKLVTIFIIVLSLLMGATLSDLSAQTEKQLAIFNQLKQTDPTIKIRWDKKTGTPARLAGKLSERIEADAKEIAMRFFKANEVLFSMTNSEQELTTISFKKDVRGWEHVKLQQIYKSLPVEGKQILVHINDNKEVQVVNGHYLPNIDLDTSATIQSAAAISSVKRDLNLQKELTQAPKAELVVYNYNEKTYLAWKTLLSSEDPLGEFIYFIDAKTGEIIDSYNNLKFTLDRNTYDANNGTSLPGTLKRSEGNFPTGDDVLDTAHFNVGRVYNYYKNQHGHDSYDNAGVTIVSTVHYDENLNNAFWNGRQLIFGDGNKTRYSPLSQSLDIVGHEFTHAVTDNESDLIYRYQSGALNESLSDIFGVLMDPPDWMIGEDVYTPGTAGDALRYMDNPTRGNQPDHMNDFVTPDLTGSTMDRSCFNARFQDNGCVHFNSGIPNKAAYLMAEGGTHHGIAVVGMGRENMGKVFYETQINWLTRDSDFMDARDATLDAVVAIFPGDISKHKTVQNAWAVVGIGDPFD